MAFSTKCGIKNAQYNYIWNWKCYMHNFRYFGWFHHMYIGKKAFFLFLESLRDKYFDHQSYFKIS